MLVVIAFSVILLPLLLVIFTKLPTMVSMTISALFALVVGVIFWKMDWLALLASSAQGAHRAITIVWILIGAITLLNVMKQSGAMDRIIQGFLVLSKDMRVQAVIVAFLFVSLLEGVAGFGSPAAIAAPLLIALGFRPLIAVTLALVGNTVACSFGAVATPLIVGLKNIPDYSEALVSSVGLHVAMIDMLIATLMPTMIVTVLVMGFRKKAKIKDVLEILPWTIFIGFSYSVSVLFAAKFLSVELVSIFASLVALIVASITAHKNILIPKNVYQKDNTKHADVKKTKPHSNMNLFVAWVPYVLVVVLLFLICVIPFVKEATQSFWNFGWTNILGVAQVSSVWNLWISPGTILIFVAVVSVFIQGLRGRHATDAFFSSIKTAALAFCVLVPTLIMVHVFINSGINLDGLYSMPKIIGDFLGAIFGDGWLFGAPFLGSIGSFMTGSTTVSTLTLSTVQLDIAQGVGLPVFLVLAQQVAGAAAGNMLAVHNIVAVSTVVGLKKQEGRILRRTLIVVLIYCCLVVVAGLAINGLLGALH